MRAWNGWYHCTGSTYGTWLPGDPRGWRSAHHREHVDGDYKQPPRKREFGALHEQSKRLMRRQRVVLNREQRKFACKAMVDALLEREVEVVVFCVGAKHFHGLVRFRVEGRHLFEEERDARRLIGQAKGKCAGAMSKRKMVAPGGIWGKKSRIRPVANRQHQLKIVSYICNHKKTGAAVILLLSAKPGASAPGGAADQ